MHKEALQRVYVGLRHMHREHFILSNPTCALRAPCVEHTLQPCFYLCRGNAGVTQTPRRHDRDNPNVLTKQPRRTQCIRVS